MLIIPTIFAVTFWRILKSPPTIKRFTFFVDRGTAYEAPPSQDHPSTDEEGEEVVIQSSAEPLISRPLAETSGNHIPYEYLSIGTLLRMVGASLNWLLQTKLFRQNHCTSI